MPEYGAMGPCDREFRQRRSVQNRLIQEPEASALDEETLISVLVNQAKAYSATKEPEAALRKFGEARKLAESLSAKHPSIGRYRDVVATLIEREAGETAPRLARSGAGPRAVRASCRHPRITCGRLAGRAGLSRKARRFLRNAC